MILRYPQIHAHNYCFDSYSLLSEVIVAAKLMGNRGEVMKKAWDLLLSDYIIEGASKLLPKRLLVQ